MPWRPAGCCDTLETPPAEPVPGRCEVDALPMPLGRPPDPEGDLADEKPPLLAGPDREKLWPPRPPPPPPEKPCPPPPRPPPPPPPPPRPPRASTSAATRKSTKRTTAPREITRIGMLRLISCLPFSLSRPAVSPHRSVRGKQSPDILPGEKRKKTLRSGSWRDPSRSGLPRTAVVRVLFCR